MSAPRSGCRQRSGNCLEALQTGQRHDSKRAAEMPGCGQRGKPKPGFPRRPPALGNRSRDSHIPAAPITTAMEKRKSESRIPTFPQRLPCQTKSKTKGDQPQPEILSFRLISGLEYAHYGLIEDALCFPSAPDFTQPAWIFHGIHDDVVPI